mmetsp:Transcript_35246/g.80714  ORF Transcript_35246/g.80714 Transcript_35246/m.80714 type:complete len:496 (-) Transcript_35246:428-1915(-)
MQPQVGPQHQRTSMLSWTRGQGGKSGSNSRRKLSHRWTLQAVSPLQVSALKLTMTLSLSQQRHMTHSQTPLDDDSHGAAMRRHHQRTAKERGRAPSMMKRMTIQHQSRVRAKKRWSACPGSPTAELQLKLEACQSLQVFPSLILQLWQVRQTEPRQTLHRCIKRGQPHQGGWSQSKTAAVLPCQSQHPCMNQFQTHSIKTAPCRRNISNAQMGCHLHRSRGFRNSDQHHRSISKKSKRSNSRNLRISKQRNTCDSHRPRLHCRSKSSSKTMSKSCQGDGGLLLRVVQLPHHCKARTAYLSSLRLMLDLQQQLLRKRRCCRAAPSQTSSLLVPKWRASLVTSGILEQFMSGWSPNSATMCTGTERTPEACWQSAKFESVQRMPHPLAAPDQHQVACRPPVQSHVAMLRRKLQRGWTCESAGKSDMKPLQLLWRNRLLQAQRWLKPCSRLQEQIPLGMVDMAIRFNSNCSTGSTKKMQGRCISTWKNHDICTRRTEA